MQPTRALPSFRRGIEHGVLVEVAAKTEAGWVKHLQDLRPRWLYALLDGGEVVVDDGAVGRLQSMAQEVLAAFVTPREVSVEIATLLWHGRFHGDRRSAKSWSSSMLDDPTVGVAVANEFPVTPPASRGTVAAR